MGFSLSGGDCPREIADLAEELVRLTNAQVYGVAADLGAGLPDDVRAEDDLGRPVEVVPGLLVHAAAVIGHQCLTQRHRDETLEQGRHVDQEAVHRDVPGAVLDGSAREHQRGQPQRVVVAGLISSGSPCLAASCTLSSSLPRCTGELSSTVT